MVEKIEKNLVDVTKNVIDVEKISNKKNKKETWGREIRRSHTALFKAAVIQELQPRVTQDHEVDKWRISQSLISKWYEEKYNIIAAATNKHKKCLQNRENQQSI